METKIRVFLVDNQEIFRKGMRSVLNGEEGIEVIGEGTSAREALVFLHNKAVDVLVMSADMADKSRSLKFAFPFIRLVFVDDSHSADTLAVANVVFISRSVPPRKLVSAIRGANAKDSETGIAPDLSKAIIDTSDASAELRRIIEPLRQRLLSQVEAL